MRSANLGRVLLVLGISSAPAADLTAAQVRQRLAAARPETPPDLSGKSLEDLDLSSTVPIFLAPTSPAPGSISPGSCGRISPTPTCQMPVSSSLDISQAEALRFRKPTSLGRE
jgi:hypothetical protein